MARVLAAGVAAVVGLLLAAPGAGAATVGQEVFSGTLDVRATPGEANHMGIDVDRGAGGPSDVVVRDAGADLTAGEGCDENPDGSVSCSLDLYLITVRLDDQDDRLTVENDDRRVQLTVYGQAQDDRVTVGPDGEACLLGGGGDDRLRLQVPGESCSFNGGAGDDVLIGSEGRDFPFGAGGDDRIEGRGGDDQAEGGHGDDQIDAGPGDDSFVAGGLGHDIVRGAAGRDLIVDDPGPDVAAGGPGDDEFAADFRFSDGDDLYVGGTGVDSFRYLCPACVVALDDEPHDGRVTRGERDDVRVETVSLPSHTARGDEIPARDYGPGTDVMAGDAADNRLSSYRGADSLTGGAGEDVLSAGRGGDVLHADDGERDAVRCGLGADVAFADPTDSLRDCETVHGRG